MERIRQHAATGSGLVFLDAPPLLVTAEASEIAARADGVVLVVRRGTPLRVLDDVRRQLDLIQATLLGYVFNRGVVGGRPAWGDYYTTGYGAAIGEA